MLMQSLMANGLTTDQFHKLCCDDKVVILLVSSPVCLKYVALI